MSGKRPKKPPVLSYPRLVYPTVLALRANNGAASIREIEAGVAKVMALDRAILEIPASSKNDRRSEFQYRLAWVRTYLKNDHAVLSDGDGRWSLTEYGWTMTEEQALSLFARMRAERRQRHDAEIINQRLGREGSVHRVEQRPAAFRFEVRRGKLQALPWADHASLDSVTVDLHTSLKTRCKETLLRLPENANSFIAQDARMAIERALQAIGDNPAALREGLALSVSRSLEALCAWLSSPDGSAEAPSWLNYVLPEIRDALNDLATRFPETSRIRASALAIDLQGKDHRLVHKSLGDIQSAADSSPVVGTSAKDALRSLDGDYQTADNLAEGAGDEGTRAAAIQRRGEILAIQLNNGRNFVTAVGNWLNAELREIGVGSWRAAKKAVPQAVGELTKGVVKASVILLVGQLFGIVTAIAVTVTSLIPDRDRLKAIKAELPGDSDPQDL